MNKKLLHPVGSRELARAGFHDGKEIRLVATKVGGKTEMLPADPVEVAKILSSRNAKRTPAQRAKQRMAAALSRRGN
jgi:hypothetical protein